jgi:hypothetical protein
MSTYQESLDHVVKSIDDFVDYLISIRTDIKSGIYTPEMAGNDVENMTSNEGNDIISTLEEISEMLITNTGGN